MELQIRRQTWHHFQRVDKCHAHLGAGGVERDLLALRDGLPSELDLMARLGGLRERSLGRVGWRAVDARSLPHVSVYGRA